MYPDILTFHPTMKEFMHFNQYIEYMESKNAHFAGIAKVIPPQSWIPRQSGYDTEDIMQMKIPHPISQIAEGKEGVYKMLNIQKKPMYVKEFKTLAEEKKLQDYFTYDEIERKYWRNLIYSPPLYGADVPGSISDESLQIWNINKLGSILDYTMKDYGVTISGVNTAYLYFGMWKSSFSWHTEDMDLYSINYLHHGQPKTWYAIPPRHGFRFQTLAEGLFSTGTGTCKAFLRHKNTTIAPYVLKNHSIPVNKITQEKGEIIITFPFGYHAGFNHGFNIAESTNFASPRWIEYGKRSIQCRCRSDVVKINMDVFVKNFQSEKYENWLVGKDIGHHPEDPNRICAAPKPLTSDNSSSDQEDPSGPKQKKPKS